MRRSWFVLGVVLLLGGSPSFGLTQELPSPPLDLKLRQEKSAWYTQVEYQRCRSDILELLVKAEPLEKRIKDLEAEVQKLTDENRTLKEGTSAQPKN